MHLSSLVEIPWLFHIECPSMSSPKVAFGPLECRHAANAISLAYLISKLLGVGDIQIIGFRKSHGVGRLYHPESVARRVKRCDRFVTSHIVICVARSAMNAGGREAAVI